MDEVGDGADVAVGVLVVDPPDGAKAWQWKERPGCHVEVGAAAPGMAFRCS
jgi:hypothetical protein